MSNIDWRLKSSILAIVLALASPAYAEYHGQFDNYKLSPDQKAWFNSVRNNQNVGCCAVSDGYPVEYEKRDDGFYYVYFKNDWRKVPHDAEIKIDNPIGVAVAWFYDDKGTPIVKCFVPNAEG